MNIYRYKTVEKAQSMAGKQLNHLLHEARGVPILLLLSGGSAFEVADRVEGSQLGGHVTVSMLDERYSLDPTVNNFAQFTGHALYQKAKESGVHTIDTRVTDESFAALAERFENALRKWKAISLRGQVIITQGIGENGHTAGIMPHVFDQRHFEERFEGESRWVAAYDTRLEGTSEDEDPLVKLIRAFWAARSTAAGHGHPLRATVTFPFLREVVDHSVVYAVGANKKPVLERVLLEKERVWEIPARIIHQMKNVTVFTDLK